MSIQAMSWVLEHSESQHGARLVLLAIAGHADDRGENSWASVGSLARQARLSERAARASLRELEADGEIEEQGRSRRGTHVYRLPAMAIQTLPVVGAETAPARSAPRKSSTSGGQSATRTPAKTAPELSRELSVEPSIGRAKKPRPRDPIWDGLVVWLGFEPKTRNERGNWNEAAKQLREIGVDSTEEVIRRGRLYQARYRGITPTPTGLASHWTEFEARAAGVSTARDGRDSSWLFDGEEAVGAR